MFENQCNQSDTKGLEVRLMLFNVMVRQTLLYGVALSHFSAWNDLDQILKNVLRETFQS